MPHDVKLSQPMVDALAEIAIGRYGYSHNTFTALRRRGLVHGGSVTAEGLEAVRGLRFAVRYAVKVDGRRFERTWDAGLDLATATADALDLRQHGPADPDAIQAPLPWGFEVRIAAQGAS